MYIIKNALRCIGRSKGRNVLIGIVVFVIATAACIGLSIRQASESARADTLSGMSVTATISFDRQSLMGNISGGGFGGSFDRESFEEMMGNVSSLTLEEYQKYANISSVKDFYYTVTVSLDGGENIEPVTTDASSSGNIGGLGGFGGGFGGMPGMGMSSADFSITGYSSDIAMTSFINGTSAIVDGSVFEEGTEEYKCIISEELATYNELSVGAVITLVNPNNDGESYDITVVGIYSDSTSNEGFAMMRGVDPANNIYMSYVALSAIISASEEISAASEEDSVRAVSGTLNVTYSFENANNYYAFEEEVRGMGLSEDYTVSSSDLSAFESSLVPLDTLSTMAGWFLIVILIVGGVVLVVLNVFNIRERKYEIGVLMAVGMKKWKVALQFLTEVFAVTISAVIIGILIGGVTSVPLTNALLENQISSSNSQSVKIEESFGRGEMPDIGNMGGFGGMQMPGGMGGSGGGKFDGVAGIFGESAANYVSEIDSAMNLTVVLQMFVIALALTLVAGAASMLFIMRYEPLKILSNRD